MKHQDVWHGSYRGISFKIAQWHFDSQLQYFESNWNYYIILNKKQIPKDKLSEFFLPFEMTTLFGSKKEYKNYRYMEKGVFAQLNWHGGVTYYRSEDETVKAGCDYQHAFDSGQVYTVEELEADAKATIADLLQRAPYLKIFCQGCGDYLLEQEMIKRAEEIWYCEKCNIKWPLKGGEEE
jgi:ribosomal protein L37AE/L43A